MSVGLVRCENLRKYYFCEALSSEQQAQCMCFGVILFGGPLAWFLSALPGRVSQQHNSPL